MFKRVRQVICAVLAIVLMFSLTPIQAANAQVVSAGLNLHAPFSNSTSLNPDGISLTESNPYQTNQSAVTISGTPVGIDPNTITYKITRVGTNQVLNDGPVPLVQGNDFYFYDITLFPGLNKIELIGRVGGSMTTMEERYVYFFNSPSISGLELIEATNVPVVNFEPKPYTDSTTFQASRSTFDAILKTTTRPITMQGNFHNATRIDLEGEEAALFGSQFVINTSNVGLVKGDYSVTFRAENNEAVMQYPYNIAISNGEPMVLAIQANMDDGNVNLDQLRSVVLNSKFKGDSNDFVFSGYLYVDHASSLSSVEIKLQRISDAVVDVDSTILNTSDLADMPILSVNNKYTVYYLDSIQLDGKYDLFANPGDYQLVIRTYDNQVPAVVHPNGQTYKFSFANENLPYIRNVTQNGTSLATNNLISRIGQQVVVEVGGTTSNVNLSASLLSVPYNPATQPAVRVGNQFIFTLDNLQPGNQQFTFTASDGTNTFEQQYFIEAVLTPTLKLSGINNDQVFNTSNIPMITAEYVNFSNPSDRANTKVLFNGATESDPYNTNNNSYYIRSVSNDTSCTNCLQGDIFGIVINRSAIVEGKNVLRFELTNGTVTSVNELTFYYLADDAPYVNVRPTPSRNFEGTEYATIYNTTEQFADFEGTVSNGSYIVVRKNGEVIAERQLVGTEWRTPSTISYVPEGTFTVSESRDSDNSWDIGMYDVNLITEYADGTLNFNATTYMTFEIYKFAKDQAPFSISSVTIQRQLAAYEPTDLTKDFLDKGVINRNYLPFTIDTDGAVAVTVNKDSMEKIDRPNSNRTRFHLDVPLKKGRNKLKIEVHYPNGGVMKDEVEILSSDVHQPGAAQKASLGKKVKFSMFDKKLELAFEKGTLVRQSNPNGGFAQLYNEVPLFFGIALDSTGLVLAENASKTAAINLMQARLRIPDQYALASPIYWIDAGQIEDLNSMDVKGGVGPFSESGGQMIHNRIDDHKLEPTKPGELTLKFNEDLRLASTPLLTVMYHDGQQWHNIGGVVSGKKGEVTVPFREFGYYAVMRMDKSFNDVINHPWARDDLEILKARGWMREISPNAFGVDAVATRGELATLLVKSLDFDLDYAGQMTFADVPVHAADPQLKWDYRYIETAARVGIVRGGRDNLFRPTDPISRQDAAVMIARAMNLKLASYEAAQKNLEKKFRDFTNIDTYAMPSVQAVYDKNIMSGKGTADGNTVSFDPKATLTRAELASITVRILKDMKRIEK